MKNSLKLQHLFLWLIPLYMNFKFKYIYPKLDCVCGGGADLQIYLKVRRRTWLFKYYIYAIPSIRNMTHLLFSDDYISDFNCF